MDTTSPANTAQARMEHAPSAANGRSAQTVHRGRDRALRQTVAALRAGATLHEPHSTREATLQVLAGRVRLTTGTRKPSQDGERRCVRDAGPTAPIS